MKHNCQAVQQEIIDHLTEAIAISDLAKLHLENCSDCQSFEQEMNQIFAASSPVSKVDDTFFETFWDQLEPKLVKETPRFVLPMPILRNIAAAMILVCSGFFLAKYVQDSPSEISEIVATEKHQDLKMVLHQSTVLLTSFNGMDQYSAKDLIPLYATQADSLTLKLIALKERYRYDAELHDVLGEIEQLLTLISTMRDESVGNIKTFQYGMKRKSTVQKFQTIDI